MGAPIFRIARAYFDLIGDDLPRACHIRHNFRQIDPDRDRHPVGVAVSRRVPEPDSSVMRSEQGFDAARALRSWPDWINERGDSAYCQGN